MVDGALLIVSSVSEFVASKEGEKTQMRIWNELSQLLENVQPGVMGVI